MSIKNLKSIFLLALVIITSTGCESDYDEPRYIVMDYGLRVGSRVEYNTYLHKDSEVTSDDGGIILENRQGESFVAKSADLEIRGKVRLTVVNNGTISSKSMIKNYDYDNSNTVTKEINILQFTKTDNSGDFYFKIPIPSEAAIVGVEKIDLTLSSSYFGHDGKRRVYTKDINFDIYDIGYLWDAFLGYTTNDYNGISFSEAEEYYCGSKTRCRYIDIKSDIVLKEVI